MKIKLTLTTREPVIIRKDDVSVICKSNYECADNNGDLFYPTDVYVHSGVKFEVLESVEDVERMVFGGMVMLSIKYINSTDSGMYVEVDGVLYKLSRVTPTADAARHE